MEEKKEESKKTFNKRTCVIAGVFLALAIAFTLVLHFIDVREIGPESSSVGLAGLNTAVRNLFPYGASGINDFWYKLTKYSGYALFLPGLFLLILAVVEFFKRKSFKKIDRELKILALFYVAVGAVYLLFEKFLIINCRPVLLDGALEPSYPSSHTLFAVTLCGSAILVNRALLKKNEKQAKVMNLLLLALMIFTVVGRLLSGVHWATDIFGGLLIGLTLLFAFKAFLERPIKNPRE